MTNKCSIDGCDKYSISNKLCASHGGKRKRCNIPECDNQTVRNGRCVLHGKNYDICPICDREIKTTKREIGNWAHTKCRSRTSPKEHRKKILKQTKNMLLDDAPILTF